MFKRMLFQKNPMVHFETFAIPEIFSGSGVGASEVSFVDS